MTLVELQDVLGRRIEIAENADIVLRAEKLMGEGKLVNSNIEKMIR